MHVNSFNSQNLRIELLVRLQAERAKRSERQDSPPTSPTVEIISPTGIVEESTNVNSAESIQKKIKRAGLRKVKNPESKFESTKRISEVVIKRNSERETRPPLVLTKNTQTADNIPSLDLTKNTQTADNIPPLDLTKNTQTADDIPPLVLTKNTQTADNIASIGNSMFCNLL